MSNKSQLTYQKSGVDYSQIDPLKILAQKAAKKTFKNFSKTGFKEVFASRGESAYVIDCGSFYLASITECLGTKALVADEVRKITGKTYYDSIAQDTIAMAVNDILTVGARPLSIHAYWASGDSNWFADSKKVKDLVKGWKKACDSSGASWAGGETPALKGVVQSQAIDLAASCVGVIKPKKRLILGKKLRAGDKIIVFASSGIHANGLTLARKIAVKLPQGYATRINKKTTYGQALLKPTFIYAQVIQALFEKNIDIHYLSNITGHGWCKIMRHPKAFTYQINKLPPVPAVLKFMVEKGSLEIKEAYKSLNMGAGMAIFVAPQDASQVLAISQKAGIKAYLVGEVQRGQKQVIIKPLKITYSAENLNLRA